jgi:threonine synthase
VEKIWANSGDSHLVEPADLFTSALPPALADLMERRERVTVLPNELAAVESFVRRHARPVEMAPRRSAGGAV